MLDISILMKLLKPLPTKLCTSIYIQAEQIKEQENAGSGEGRARGPESMLSRDTINCHTQ